MLTYYKLFDYLNRNDINKTELRRQAKLSNGTMNRLVHNEVVQTDAIDRICAFLQLQPGDIMEYESHTSNRKKLLK